MDNFNKFIRDSVHGDIHLKERVIYDLINTAEYQRLRRITQLGGGQFVFPSANHTRFSHGLGVYHVICKFLENPSFETLNPQDKIEVQIAGLLHDVGHGPFSHSFEGITVKKHEKYSQEIITGKTEINDVLIKAGINPQNVAAIISGEHSNPILNSLVSSQLDADRLDYLTRDSYYCGVNYSKLDIHWIIRHATIMENKIVFPQKTLYAIESYLLGRYHMYQQVYRHPVSLSFDVILKKWFLRLKDLYDAKFQFKNQNMINVLKDWLENREISLEDYLFLDDYTLIDFIKNSTIEGDKILADLSSRIIRRNFFGCWTESEKTKLEEFKQQAKYDEKYYYEIREQVPIAMYNSKKSSKKDESIYIIDKSNKISGLEKVSKIVTTTEHEKLEKINPQNIYIFPKIMYNSDC